MSEAGIIFLSCLSFVGLICVLVFITKNKKDLKDINIKAKDKSGRELSLITNLNKDITEQKEKILNNDIIDRNSLLEDADLNIKIEKSENYTKSLVSMKEKIKDLNNKLICSKTYIIFYGVVDKWLSDIRFSFKKTLYENGITNMSFTKYAEYIEKKIEEINNIFNNTILKCKDKGLKKRNIESCLLANYMIYRNELIRIYKDLRKYHEEAEKERIKNIINISKKEVKTKDDLMELLEIVKEYSNGIRYIEDTILEKDLHDIKCFVLGCFLTLLEEARKLRIKKNVNNIGDCPSAANEGK